MPPVEAAELVERIWARDATLWTGSDEARWLGWLDEPVAHAGADARGVPGLAEGREALSSYVLLGMGGSSLAPEVMRRFSARTASTSSTARTRRRSARSQSSLDLDDTLFIVSSKSGTTLETRCHLDYFWGTRTGGSAAVTDPGSELEALGRERGFAAVVWGEPTIGGRYSALSPFGLVPGALMGLDVEQLMEGAAEMAGGLPHGQEPGRRSRSRARARLARGSRQGRRRGGERLRPLARATPCGVDWEERQGPRAGARRVAEGADRQEREVEVGGVRELGAELYRWEFATAVAGTILEINPFDQPNVQEAKDRTLEVLSGHGQVPGTGTRPEGTAAVEELLAGAQPGDYIAVLAFIDPEREGELRPLVERARSTGCVVTVGLGPRYLHSTGQLHKGGPPSGRFVQVVDDPGEELAIPGRPFGFRTLIHAQAEGDLAALEERGRPIVRVTLDDLEAL